MKSKEKFLELKYWNINNGLYFGEVKNNTLNGRGFVFFKNLIFIFAEFKNNKLDGICNLFLPDGSFLKLAYKDNIINGNCYLLNNNLIFLLKLKNNKINGYLTKINLIFNKIESIKYIEGFEILNDNKNKEFEYNIKDNIKIKEKINKHIFKNINNLNEDNINSNLLFLKNKDILKIGHIKEEKLNGLGIIIDFKNKNMFYGNFKNDEKINFYGFLNKNNKINFYNVLNGKYLINNFCDNLIGNNLEIENNNIDINLNLEFVSYINKLIIEENFKRKKTILKNYENTDKIHTKLENNIDNIKDLIDIYKEEANKQSKIYDLELKNKDDFNNSLYKSFLNYNKDNSENDNPKITKEIIEKDKNIQKEDNNKQENIEEGNNKQNKDINNQECIEENNNKQEIIEEEKDNNELEIVKVDNYIKEIKISKIEKKFDSINKDIQLDKNYIFETPKKKKKFQEFTTYSDSVKKYLKNFNNLSDKKKSNNIHNTKCSTYFSKSNKKRFLNEQKKYNNLFIKKFIGKEEIKKLNL